MFKKGDRVRCVDNLRHRTAPEKGVVSSLTVGGIYIVRTCMGPYLNIVDDDGVEVDYFSYRFVPVRLTRNLPEWW